MFCQVGPPYRGGVLVTIRREASQPLAGLVWVENGKEERFVGWLQLLGILSRVLNSDPQPPGARGASRGESTQPRSARQGRCELDS